MSKRPRRAVNGILLLNKSTGVSSNFLLQKVKYLYQAKKAGHTGSLDPLATGMLPICLGEATKFSQFLLDADKTYVATAKLGVVTSTGDVDGEVIRTEIIPKAIQPKDIQQRLTSIVPKFLGVQQQIPPMYSALKHQGQPLYKLARQGINIERKARQVTIHELEVLDASSDSFTVRVKCSKGTYIRSLIEDMGQALQWGATVASLHRESVEPFNTGKMIGFEELATKQDTMALDQLLLPMDAGIIHLPKLVLTQQQVQAIQFGQKVSMIMSADYARLYSPDHVFLGIGKRKANGMLQAQRLVRTN